MSRILTEFFIRSGHTLKNDDCLKDPSLLKDLAAECLQTNGLESNMLDEKSFLVLSESSRAELIMVIKYIF